MYSAVQQRLADREYDKWVELRAALDASGCDSDVLQLVREWGALRAICGGQAALHADELKAKFDAALPSADDVLGILKRPVKE